LGSEEAAKKQLIFARSQQYVRGQDFSAIGQAIRFESGGSETLRASNRTLRISGDQILHRVSIIARAQGVLLEGTMRRLFVSSLPSQTLDYHLGAARE
jgi:hypothetical protein